MLGIAWAFTYAFEVRFCADRSTFTRAVTIGAELPVGTHIVARTQARYTVIIKIAGLIVLQTFRLAVFAGDRYRFCSTVTGAIAVFAKLLIVTAAETGYTIIIEIGRLIAAQACSMTIFLFWRCYLTRLEHFFCTDAIITTLTTIAADRRRSRHRITTSIKRILKTTVRPWRLLRHPIRIHDRLALLRIRRRRRYPRRTT